jgi:predicted transcriptional regulator
MDELCALLFELSNEDRLNILRELKKKPMKLSRVSERFNFTVPETARNMTRLAEADLIAKGVDGYFHLTPIGEAILQFIPSFEFISSNRKYFKTHTFSVLPTEFAASIGALRKSEYVNGVTEMLFNAENAVKESREFMWIIVDQILPSSLPFFLEAIARGVEVRKLMPRNAVIPPAILELANDPAFDRAARAKKVESRYLDTIGIFMFLSEKELAGIGFANLEGIFDYGSFRSRDETALKWAKSLFLHYWGRAKRE